MSRLRQLIREIHRRSLWQVMLIYIGAAWACFELIATVADTMGLPAWLPGLAIVLFLLGLPLVVATAVVREEAVPLADEVAPADGVSVESQEEEAARRRRFLTRRNAGLSFLAALAVWGVIATGWILIGERPSTEGEERKSIAVLPFDNIGGAQENEAFTDGIHDDIITHLQKIGGLTPISRTSVMGYRHVDRNLRQIADELGVETILEGGVQRLGNQVRINAQLIDAETDGHLWAESYNEQLTAENVFSIQTDIARRIASALRAQLTLDESERIATRPTENLEAYEYYLRALEYYKAARSRQDYETAEGLFRRAIELDPDFALAYAWLSRVHRRFFRRLGDRTEARKAAAREAADRALELQPDLPEAHGAMGVYYYDVEQDWDLSIKWNQSALALRPNDAQFLGNLGLTQRRLGDVERALGNLERAYELDPMNRDRITNLYTTYINLRRYPEAERMLDRHIAFFPDRMGTYFWKAWALVSLRGQTEEAQQALELGAQATGRHRLIFFAEAHVYRERSLFRVLSKFYIDEAVRVDHPSQDTVGNMMLRALALRMSGRLDDSRIYYDSARVIEERKLTELIDYRADRLGIIYAGLGLRQDAVRFVKDRIEAVKADRNMLALKGAVADLAEIYVIIGDFDAAVTQLEELLSMPSGVGTPLLRLDPLYDPLRNHPRFQALLGKDE